MSDNRTLSGVYIGLARDWKPSDCTADRLEHIEHIANRGAPLPADETLWLLGVAREAISDRDECQRLIAMCADTIATASDTLAAIIPADSTDNERNEA